MTGRGWLLLVTTLTLALAGSALLALWLAVEASPSAPPRAGVEPADIERALQLVRSHDPRHQRAGLVRALIAEERDLVLLLQHAAARFAGAGTRIGLTQGRAVLDASVPLAVALPLLPPWLQALASDGHPPWINLHIEMTQSRGLPELSRLRVGRLPLPAWAAEPLLRWWLERRGWGVDLELPRDVVRHVEFRPQRVVVFYAWRQDTLSRMLATLVPPADQERLRAYSDRLVEMLRDEAAGTPIPLVRLLQPAFELAQRRSALPGADAARENRAALLALVFYANQRGLAAIVPAARNWPRPPQLTVTLAGRLDLPLHVLISAAIAAESGTPLADAVGLYKEVNDSRQGSGFSFNDLAADRAGTRLGERAVRAPAELQARLAHGIVESELLPDISDLPEFLSADEFAKRYGSVGAPGYLLMMREIEARLDLLTLLR